MNNFLFKTRCELIIVSNEVDVNFITKKLDLSPNRFFNKGDQTISKYSGSVITKPHNLWAIKSEFSVSENETISHHIDFFKPILIPKMSILEQFKKDPLIEVTFWIWIETDNGGIGLDIEKDELAFLNAVADTVHISLLCKNEIQE